MKLDQPVLSAIPYFGGWFSFGTTRMSGATTTVKQTSPRVGPSMRFVADLADGDNSQMNIMTGQSGQALSNHRKDQWELHWAGQSLRMQFDRVEAEDSLTLSPEN